MPTPFVYGRDTKFKVVFNATSWPVNVKTWSVTEVVVQAVDQVNGEDRARLQKITDYYDVEFDCYEDGSSQILQNILSNQSAQDAGLADPTLASGIVFKYRDGSRAGFVLKECTLGPLNMTDGGRTTAFMNRMKFRARYFEQVPTV